MNQRSLQASMLAFFLMFSPSPSQCADLPSTEKIATIIEKSNILGEGYKVSAAINGNEAIISTYRNKESKAQDQDCKIEAALIAKELMITNDFGIRRVKVNFYEPAMVGQVREVTVSYAEVKAFAAGAIEQKDFLDSLGITFKQDPGHTGDTKTEVEQKTASADNEKQTKADDNVQSTPENGSKTASSTDEAKPSTGSKIASSVPAKPAAKKRPRYVHPRTGISFELPEGWTVEDKFQTQTLLKLISSQTKYDNISMLFDRQDKTPAILAAEQKKRFNYPEAHCERYEMTTFGQGQYKGALFVVNYPNWEDNQKPYYEMALYCGKPGGIYTLRGWSTDSTYRIVSKAFYDIMTTIAFPGSGSTSAGSKPKPR